MFYGPQTKKAAEDALRTERVAQRDRVRSAKDCTVFIEDAQHLFALHMSGGEGGGAEEVKNVQAVLRADDAELPQNDDEEKQRELIILQAQLEGIQGQFQSLHQSLQQAVKTIQGEQWARKLNSTLGMIDQYDRDMNAVSRDIKQYLTVNQLTEQFKRDFIYQEKVQDFKQEVLMWQMEYFKDNPQSASKPQGMVVIPTKVPVEDNKLVKLPTQELPTFSGDYPSWTPFLDSFQAMVGSKSNISEPAKLGFLKSALRGEPKTMIMRLENNNSGNYDRAMNILTERYQNTRAIVRSHLDNIINSPIVKSDNSNYLRKHIQCIEDNLDGLRQAGVNTNGWGPILAYHMYQKLDNDTRRDFEIQFPGTHVQKVPELLKFLKERAAALETYSATGKKPAIDQQKPKSTSGGVYAGQQESAGSGYFGNTQSYRNSKCSKCDGDHHIYRCDDFLALTMELRDKWVKDNEICRNCLKKGHLSAKCASKYVCKICKKRHNTLLHFAKPGDPGQVRFRGNVNHVTRGKFFKHPLLAASTSAVTPTTVPIQLQVTVTPAPGLPAAVTAVPPAGTPSTAPATGTQQALHVTGTSGAGYLTEDVDECDYTPLLGTAQVPVLNHEGELVYGRALLDSGSHLNFITNKFASTLGLTKMATKCTVHTIGAVQPSATVGSVSFLLATPDGDRLPVRAHILTKVTGVLPQHKLDISRDFSPKWDNLADSEFDKPGEIDLLIGCEIYEELMLGEKRKYGTLTATSSRLGWVITGTALLDSSNNSEEEFVSTPDPFTSAHTRLADHDIISFWEVNDIKDTSVLAKDPSNYTPEEQFVSQHFDDTTVIGDDGRFSVSLPFKKSTPDEPKLELGYSRGPAVRMQVGQEKKFAVNPPFGSQYGEFVHEFIHDGHLVLVDEAEIHKLPNTEKYYLPHHAVEKESTTTKLRVVMNASSRSSTGVTLNDTIAVGPTLQDQLVCHLLRFRFHRVALSGDISKMYRQVMLNSKDRKFHLFLWRDHPDEDLRCYEMTRVTYGVASSSYHAIRALQQAARDSGMDAQIVAAVLRDFYVDDIMTGAGSVVEAQNLMLGIIELLQRSKLLIRKWASNEASIIQALPEQLRENVDAFDVAQPQHNEHTLKTLGVRWRPAQDYFHYTVSHVEFEAELLGVITKRELLGDILKLFDPTGHLSPVTLKLKVFMQLTWAQGLTWDQPLPEDVKENFLLWRNHLPALRTIKIPRCVLAPGAAVVVQFHVFCDASALGYAACLYVRIVDGEGFVNVNLLFAKAKVAPVKALSIPRLELMAAVLGTKILTIATTSVESIGVKPDQVFAYSDSTTVLAWLAKPSRSWTTFVQNRVSEIQSSVQRHQWFHVRTEENPADVASRGTFPELLQGNSLWWHGPSWLSLPSFDVPDQTHLQDKTDLEVSKDPTACFFVNPGEPQPEELFQDLKHTSELEHHIRVTVHVLRFLVSFKRTTKNQCLTKIRDLHQGEHYPSPVECSYVRNLFIRREQSIHLGKELAILAKGESLPRKHHLSRLYPFLDDGVLKVGGRLHATDVLPEERKYQIIVPKNGDLARLLVSQAHLKLYHGTLQGCLAALAQRYWVVGARELVRKHLRGCTLCYRYVCKPQAPLMGDLPKERVSPNAVFDYVGVDFAGPFFTRASGEFGPKSGPLKLKKLRQQSLNPSTPVETPTTKSYLALFVCMSSKAVHLELVGSLSGPCCIAAFRRFAARRGAPIQVFSDNGSNFIGTSRELERLQEALDKKGKDSLPAVAATYGSTWVHIPPRAPHFGGLWESAVKSAKTHLKKIVGKQVFTFEELSTVFTIIEAILNSRPLVELTSSESDFQALTPGMLMCGKQVRPLPLNIQENLPEALSLNELHPAKRWAHITKITAHFWKRWLGEYLPTLQVRKKWTVEKPNFQQNDMVLLAEDSIKPLHWPLARILEVYPGNDGVVRVAKVKTPHGVYTRPVVKLRKLPMSTNQ